MNRRSHWAIIGFFACIGSLIHVYVYRLEARVRRIDRLDSVNARSHVDSYFEVARVYLREGRTDDARESLLKGLKLDAWNFEGQISLARIEMDEGQLETAAERARFVTTHGPPGWMPEARKILEHPTAAGLVDRTRALPQVEGAVLYLLGFEGISDTLLEFMKGQISREYSISVDILPDRAKATDQGARAHRAGVGSRQIHCDNVLTQMRREYRGLVSRKDVLGILGVSAEDMYADGLNFLFGATADRVGLMSTARFDLPDRRPGSPEGAVPGVDEVSVMQTRAVKQSFSSVGFLLGIDRCTMPGCARAYPHSLSELDRKGVSLCLICRSALLKQRI